MDQIRYMKVEKLLNIIGKGHLYEYFIKFGAIGIDESVVLTYGRVMVRMREDGTQEIQINIPLEE